MSQSWDGLHLIMKNGQYVILMHVHFLLHWEKNAFESKAFLSKSMHIMDSNQYDIELVTYLLVLVVYFYELIVYMLLERNSFDSISFFSQCTLTAGNDQR